MAENSETPSEPIDGPTRHKTISITLDNIEAIDKTVRQAVSQTKDVAVNAGDTIKDTIKKVKTARDSVVMVRVNKDALEKLDELVDSGLNSSRSEAAAFMIAQGIKVSGDLFGKIAEKTEIIRKAREELRTLLDEKELTA